MIHKRIIRRLVTAVEMILGKINILASPNIFFGCDVQCSSSAKLSATDGGFCEISENVKISSQVEITCREGVIVIGGDTYIGKGSVIVCRQSIKVGAKCLIGEYVTIRDQQHIFGYGKITADSGFMACPIDIGDNVWIGAKATVLAGVQIGENSVIGAGAVVISNIPANSLAVGVPAKVVRKID